MLLFLKILPNITLFQHLMYLNFKVNKIKHKQLKCIILGYEPNYIPKYQGKYIKMVF